MISNHTQHCSVCLFFKMKFQLLIVFFALISVASTHILPQGPDPNGENILCKQNNHCLEDTSYCHKDQCELYCGKKYNMCSGSQSCVQGVCVNDN